MRKLVVALCLASGTSACGSFNVNELLASKVEKEAIDSLVQEAQYEYDKGRYDSALNLTNKALAINPNSESPTILKSYVFLSKSGLDAINISKKMIKANESSKKPATTTTTPPVTTETTVKSGDTTTDNFNILKSVMNLSDTDFDQMGTGNTIGDPQLKIYIPFSATQAREGSSESLAYLNEAVATLCPLVLPNANPADDVDPRHDCPKNTFASAAKGRSNFAWSLAHLGEAITFYSVLLYDSDGDGIPNLEAAIPKEKLTIQNADKFITTVNGLNRALIAIFPTEEAAVAASMLNALFADLKTTSTALSSIPGVPTEVSDSIQKSITELDAKIASITSSTAGANAAGAQNEALKNSLTTGLATALESKIESSEFTKLNPDDQVKACCVYRSMNAKAERPTTCASIFYNDPSCATALPN